jgi:hypothetical protein
MSQGPSAEFDALRQEIESRRNIQNNLFALQLTVAAAIFSFALSGKGHAEFLLIIPISSFALCAEYAHQETGINNVARYIKEKLSLLVSGGLNWESWLHDPANVPPCEALRKTAAIVAFVIAPLGALGWAVPDVFWSGYKLSSGGEDSPTIAVAGGTWYAIIITWIIGLVVSLSNIWIILHVNKLKDQKDVAASIKRSINASHKHSRHKKGWRWVRSHSLCSLFGFPAWTAPRMVEVARALENCEIEMRLPIGEARGLFIALSSKCLTCDNGCDKPAMNKPPGLHKWILLSCPSDRREGPTSAPGRVSIRGHIDEAALYLEVIGLYGRKRYQIEAWENACKEFTHPVAATVRDGLDSGRYSSERMPGVQHDQLKKAPGLAPGHRGEHRADGLGYIQPPGQRKRQATSPSRGQPGSGGSCARPRRRPSGIPTSPPATSPSPDGGASRSPPPRSPASCSPAPTTCSPTPPATVRPASREGRQPRVSSRDRMSRPGRARCPD